MTVKDENGSTRRTVLRAGMAVIGAVAAAPGARAQEKIAPAMVQYQPTPKDGNKCANCVNYVEPGACKIVSGVIDPNGWCIAYAPKAS